MKKLFLIFALIGTMSMNAQVIQLKKGNTVVATYTAKQVDNVVFKEETTGTAKRTGDIDVNWVRLWKDGPKFAEYNVGAKNNKAEDYGGYYTWGGTYMNGNGITWKDDHNTINTGTGNLTGTDDTATNLWGSNWRMPTGSEFQGLLDNCTCTFTTQNGVKGLLCTGKDAYSSNSVFLPAAGMCYTEAGHPMGVICNGAVLGEGLSGNYWSSSPGGSVSAFYLAFGSGIQCLNGGVNSCRDFGNSVRAVFAE